MESRSNNNNRHTIISQGKFSTKNAKENTASKGCVEIYLDEEDMFGGKDDQFEFENNNDEMYWIEYDINNLEDDDYYVPRRHSMEFADN